MLLKLYIVRLINPSITCFTNGSVTTEVIISHADVFSISLHLISITHGMDAKRNHLFAYWVFTIHGLDSMSLCGCFDFSYNISDRGRWVKITKKAARGLSHSKIYTIRRMLRLKSTSASMPPSIHPFIAIFCMYHNSMSPAALSLVFCGLLSFQYDGCPGPRRRKHPSCCFQWQRGEERRWKDRNGNTAKNSFNKVTFQFHSIDNFAVLTY